MLDLTISIINYKTKELSAKCLDSILKKNWKTTYEIFLVDNNSDDGSLEFFKKNYPKVNLIASKKNLGFAGGHNLVLKQVNSKYILVLNSDTEILTGSLDEMIKFMDANEKIGVASCRILNADGSLQPNGGDLPFGWSLVSWLFNLEAFGIISPAFHRNESKYYQNIHEVGWVSGSFMIIRKVVLEKIQPEGFSEKFFMYMEDVEFCNRVKKTGFKISINPQISIKHLSGASSKNPRYRQWLGEYQGLLILYRSLYGKLSAFFIRILIYKACLLRMLAFLLIGKGEIAGIYAKVITNL